MSCPALQETILTVLGPVNIFVPVKYSIEIPKIFADEQPYLRNCLQFEKEFKFWKAHCELRRSFALKHSKLMSKSRCTGGWNYAKQTYMHLRTGSVSHALRLM